MKIFNYSLAIIASFALLSSCSNNDDETVVNNDVKVKKTFSVGTSTATSRVHKSESSYEVHWDAGDNISLFAKGHSKGDPFQINDDFEDNFASFTGFTYNADEYWALSPAQNDAELRPDGYLQFTIPSVQTATVGTFDPNAAIQIGHIEGSTGEFSLKNVCAYFALTLEANCEYVTIQSTDNSWWLAGTVYAEARSASAAIEGFVEGKCQKEISLTNIPASGGTFYVPFIPSDRHPGVEVIVKYKGRSMSSHYQFKPGTSTNISFSASYVYQMGTFHDENIPDPPYVDPEP